MNTMAASLPCGLAMWLELIGLLTLPLLQALALLRIIEPLPHPAPALTA